MGESTPDKRIFLKKEEECLASCTGAPMMIMAVSHFRVMGGRVREEVTIWDDIAVLRLNRAAPSWATSYELSDLTDLTGQDFNVAGYGARSTIGGNFVDKCRCFRVRICIIDDDSRTCFGQAAHDRRTDASGSAGHQRIFSGQFVHASILPR